VIAAWVILPTYNEAENIAALVRALRERLREGDRILIVDDNSPDGTGDIADELAVELPEVTVLHRAGKEGLGRAYLAGFKHALGEGAGLVLEMDSDFSHDPADVPRLIAAAEDGADLVLGSRYVRGGSVEDWGLGRRLVSRGGSWYARKVLGVRVRDLTGGFKCFRRAALEGIDLDDIHANGYGFQIEMTYRAINAGFRVAEIPIAFRDRCAGESKMDARIALEAVWKVPALRARARLPLIAPATEALPTSD
jgi:dolichol-phosphate mannosyltransferase